MTLKRILYILSFSALVCISCKNTLNIQAPYKDITVVYGLLDQNDHTHYIRINKGFEGAGDAYTMAKQYDSIYYPTGTIKAVLEDSNPNTDAIQNIIPLDTTTAIPLGPGTFSYPKQLLYYTNAILNPNDYYNLVITNTKTGKTLRGSTILLPDVDFKLPSNIATTHNFSLGTTANPTEIEWNSSITGRIYQMTFLFYYDNQITNGSRVLQAPLTLPFAPQTAPTGGGIPMSYTISQQQLFTLITGSLQPESGVTRYVDSLGIIFTTGTDDLNTYIQLSQPSTGINQDVPSFSDVINGVGLYTARHVQTFSFRNIDPATFDSLTQEPRFINLGFQP